jgi:hypothetical protein
MRRIAHVLVTIGVLLSAFGYCTPYLRLRTSLGPGSLAAGTVTLVLGLVLASARPAARRRRWFTAGVLLALGCVALGFGVALVASDPDPARPRLVLGVPLRVAVLWYVAGLAPLIALPLVYAATFDGGQSAGTASTDR